MSVRRVCFPPRFALNSTFLNNPIRQIGTAAFEGDCEVEPYSKRKIKGERVELPSGEQVLVVTRRVKVSGSTGLFLNPTGAAPGTAPELQAIGRRAKWIVPGSSVDVSDPTIPSCNAILASWKSEFSFTDTAETASGALRPPQIGALYAILAHWKVSTDPATVVMPTGTGKTEAMLALLVKERLPKLLVIVPTDALREQTAGKFLSLGLLRNIGVVGSGALNPRVGILEHELRTANDVREYFSKCNVVISTMDVVTACSESVRSAMAEASSHLIIDEAHHIAAPTWARFRQTFIGRTPILQFTATPFRRDRKHIDGKIIFNYPLRKAQEEGYFAPITFRAVTAFFRDKADRDIATNAIEQLEADLAAGYDHLVMARVEDTARANDLFAVYRELGSPHCPVVVHSKVPRPERQIRLAALRSRTSRIVICVDMLGEGFDLPELKIAALHDMHKSLAITLQFTGRFTRARADLGGATVIANIASAEVDESLRELYSEDPDWNVLMRWLSEGATGREARRSDFIEGFRDAPAEIAIQNILPKMSTVVYSTACDQWQPERFTAAIRESDVRGGPAINQQERVLVFVTRTAEMVPWGDFRDIQNLTWDLYVLHWDTERHLLFINSSNNDTLHDNLAKAVAGDGVALLNGEQVFRSLHGFGRLVLTNLGLSHSLSHAVRFMMYVGADVRAGLAEAQLQNKFKTNIFGRGFKDGEKTSIGCSRKGRIWAHEIAPDIPAWIEWCHGIGAKLTDASISFEEILKHVLIPDRITARPDLAPLVIEWSEFFLQRNEDRLDALIGGRSTPFTDVELALSSHDPTGPLRFKLRAEGREAEYEMVFGHDGVQYQSVGELTAEIRVGSRRKPVSEWFREEPPIVRYEDGVFTIENYIFRPKSERQPFDAARIEAWAWTGVDLRKESQTTARLPDSIQRHVIQQIQTDNWDRHYDVIFDDDDTNEAADIVATAISGDRLLVDLFHCKYSKKNAPGSRVEDLYAVCGQAQRSVFWRSATERLLRHLLDRERARLKKSLATRFERGDMARINDIIRRVRFLIPEFRILIVQPGLSKQDVTPGQLDLLATTELYLQETHGIPLRVIGSA